MEKGQSFHGPKGVPIEAVGEVAEFKGFYLSTPGYWPNSMINRFVKNRIPVDCATTL
jgi:hypothetical protein